MTCASGLPTHPVQRGESGMQMKHSQSWSRCSTCRGMSWTLRSRGCLGHSLVRAGDARRLHHDCEVRGPGRGLFVAESRIFSSQQCIIICESDTWALWRRIGFRQEVWFCGKFWALLAARQDDTHPRGYSLDLLLSLDVRGHRKASTRGSASSVPG